MQLTVSAITFVASLLLCATATPIDSTAQPAAEKRETCTIKLTFIDSWTDSGLHRFRHAPSTTKANVDLEDVLNDFWPYAATSGATSKPQL